MTWQTLSDSVRSAIGPLPTTEREVIPQNMDAIISFAVARWENRFGGAPDAAAWRDQGIRNIARLHKYAESPIERALAPYLIFSIYSSQSTPKPAEVYCPGGGLDLEAAYEPCIIPQFNFIRYRADFAVVAGPPGRRRHIVVVECDGKETHGGAWCSDAKRDGLFACFGIETVRATGTEIYTAPITVIDRINVALSRSMARLS